MTALRTSTDARLAAACASRALATVGAAALTLAALGAACAPEVDPHSRAPRTPLPDEEVDRVLRAAGATGSGHPVWVVNPAWVDGDPGATPLLRDGRWVAPTGTADTRGTLLAHQSTVVAGRLTVAVLDRDAELADALTALGPDEALVADGDDWLVVTGDRVRPLRVAGAAQDPSGGGSAAIDTAVGSADHRSASGSTPPGRAGGDQPVTIAGLRDRLRRG